MRTFALALACLLCACHGRRAQLTGSLAELQEPDVAKALATLLLASNPEAAFNVNMGRSQAVAAARHRASPVSRPYVTVYMADEDEKPKKKAKSKKPKEKVKVPKAAIVSQLPQGEQVFFEGPPARSEALLPGLSVVTVFGIIPFGAAISRQIWTRYKFTTRRMQIRSGFKGTDVVQVIWREVAEVVWLRRWFGTAGDIVFTLLDGSKIEVRSVPAFERNLKFIMDMCGDEVKKESRYPDLTNREYLKAVEEGKQPPATIENALGQPPKTEEPEEKEPAPTA